ncbi:MAG: NTP transferase domain-containing protein [Muribaculaceae bacterium]|nr:NTP transferase domain-containing protein [Muribaculaceae bacterium]
MNFGIIAAGEGSRLVEEGVAYPKPLVPLNGKPMIGRLIDIFIRNGAERIAVIVNEQMTEVREFLFSIKDELPVRLDIVVKSTPSSMHSFYEVARLLDGHGRFIATTVDTIFHENDFSRYVEAYSSAAEDVDGMMALTRFVDDEKPLYVEVGNDGFIKAFLDKATAEAEFVSGGIYGLNSSAVKVLDGCMERGVSRMRNFQRELIAAGLRIKGYDMGKIIDVDHAGDIRKAEEFIK